MYIILISVILLIVLVNKYLWAAFIAVLPNDAPYVQTVI
jgi:hypothetical protein